MNLTIPVESLIEKMSLEQLAALNKIIDDAQWRREAAFETRDQAVKVYQEVVARSVRRHTTCRHPSRTFPVFGNWTCTAKQWVAMLEHYGIEQFPRGGGFEEYSRAFNGIAVFDWVRQQHNPAPGFSARIRLECDQHEGDEDVEYTWSLDFETQELEQIAIKNEIKWPARWTK